MHSPHTLHTGRTLTRNAILNLIGNGIPLLVGIFAIPIIIGGLGTEAFGAFQLGWAVLAYFAMFDLGLGRATNKFVAEYIGRGDLAALPGIVVSSSAIQTVLGVLGGVLLAALVPFLINRVFNIDPSMVSEVTTAFRLLAAAVPVVLVATSFRGVLQAFQRFDLVNAVQAATGVATYILPVVALSFGAGLVGVVALTIGVRFVALGAYASLCYLAIPPLRRPVQLRLPLLRRLIAYGGWVTVSNVVAPLLVYLDRIVIGSLLTLTAVTYYTAPYEVISRFTIIPASIVPPLFSAFSTIAATHDMQRLQSLFYRAAKVLLIVTAPIALAVILVARPGLALWLGEDFADRSTLVAQIFMAGMFINAMAQLPYATLQGVGRADLVAKFHVVELPIHVVLLWHLVPRWGIVGAAYAFFARITLDAILLYTGTLRVYGLPGGKPLKQFFIRAGGLLPPLALVTILVAELASTLIARLAGIALITAIYLAVTWRFLLEPDERANLASLLGLGANTKHRSGN